MRTSNRADALQYLRRPLSSLDHITSCLSTITFVHANIPVSVCLFYLPYTFQSDYMAASLK